MKNINLEEQDTKELITAVRRVIGQLKHVEKDLEEKKVRGQTFTQLLAIKGGANKICKEIISRGVMSNIQSYSKEEIDSALDIIFKLG